MSLNVSEFAQSLASNGTDSGFHYGGSPGEQALGFGILIVGCCCFGTMFLPLKRYDCGDGILF